MSDIKRSFHSYYKLKYHLVIVTKYRHPTLANAALNDRLIALTYYIFEEKWGLEVIEVNTDRDHVHILFSSTPKVCLANLVNNYKTVTARLLRKEFADFLAQYYWKPYFWNRSYYIGSISDTTEAVVQEYIRMQGT